MIGDQDSGVIVTKHFREFLIGQYYLAILHPVSSDADCRILKECLIVAFAFLQGDFCPMTFADINHHKINKPLFFIKAPLLLRQRPMRRCDP